MHVGHQQEPRGNNRRKQGKVTGISTPLALRRPWQILAVLAALFVPASGLIFAQSGFVPFSNSIIALDASPDDASIVVAGTLNVPVPAGIYRSTDGGHTWSRANADLPPDTSVASIRFDPQDGNRVLAADGGVGNLFISEDGGLNWRQEPSISQVLTSNSGIGRLFTRIEDGQTVFYAGSRYDGVVRSVDGGLSWEWYGEGLTGSALRVRAFVDKDGALYAGTHDGVWRLTPDSRSWQRVNLPAGIIARGMTILDGRLHVGTFASGLYLSDDGYNWVQDPSFPAGVVIYDLTASGQEVVVGTNVGLWTQSVPDWTRVSVNGAAYTNPVFRLASSSTFVGVTYAGTEQDGVLRTLDSGVTFLSSAHITPLDPAELPGRQRPLLQFRPPRQIRHRLPKRPSQQRHQPSPQRTIPMCPRLRQRLHVPLPRRGIPMRQPLRLQQQARRPRRGIPMRQLIRQQSQARRPRRGILMRQPIRQQSQARRPRRGIPMRQPIRQQSQARRPRRGIPMRQPIRYRPHVRQSRRGTPMHQPIRHHPQICRPRHQFRRLLSPEPRRLRPRPATCQPARRRHQRPASNPRRTPHLPLSAQIVSTKISPGYRRFG